MNLNRKGLIINELLKFMNHKNQDSIGTCTNRLDDTIFCTFMNYCRIAKKILV